MSRKVLVTKLPKCCRACMNQGETTAVYGDSSFTINNCDDALFMVSLMIGQCPGYKAVFTFDHLKDKYTERYLLK